MKQLEVFKFNVLVIKQASGDFMGWAEGPWSPVKFLESVSKICCKNKIRQTKTQVRQK